MIRFRSGVSRLKKVLKTFEKATAELELAEQQIIAKIDKNTDKEQAAWDVYAQTRQEVAEQNTVLWAESSRAQKVRQNIAALISA